ncbi:MAG TPA: xanthine phosphoribosyltransferase [Alphaproteobacteria bacterium]|jgi:xanthine phosphoribosyltransferase
MPHTDPETAGLIVSWDDVHRDARALVRKLMGLGPWQGIIALTRGGLVPAAIVAREMEIRVIDTLCIATYEEQKMEGVNILKQPEAAVAVQGKGWLLIDDLVDTGTTLQAARKLLPQAYFATVYGKPKGLPLVDAFIHQVPQDQWVYFPWDLSPSYAPPLVRRT